MDTENTAVGQENSLATVAAWPSMPYFSTGNATAACDCVMRAERGHVQIERRRIPPESCADAVLKQIQKISPVCGRILSNV